MNILEFRRPPFLTEEHSARLERASMRLAIEDSIERLITLLDDLDGDPDIEADDNAEDWHQPPHLRGGANHVPA